jgi:hypothetical protein
MVLAPVKGALDSHDDSRVAQQHESPDSEHRIFLNRTGRAATDHIGGAALDRLPAFTDEIGLCLSEFWQTVAFQIERGSSGFLPTPREAPQSAGLSSRRKRRRFSSPAFSRRAQAATVRPTAGPPRVTFGRAGFSTPLRAAALALDCARKGLRHLVRSALDFHRDMRMAAAVIFALALLAASPALGLAFLALVTVPIWGRRIDAPQRKFEVSAGWRRRSTETGRWRESCLAGQHGSSRPRRGH